MKYHKIRNIPLDVCTVEQMVAYNLASTYAIDCVKSGKFHTYAEIAQYITANFYNGKYDIDTVFCALNAGIEAYCKAKYHILTSYGEIGKMFPANYLNNKNASVA